MKIQLVIYQNIVAFALNDNYIRQSQIKLKQYSNRHVGSSYVCIPCNLKMKPNLKL